MKRIVTLAPFSLLVLLVEAPCSFGGRIGLLVIPIVGRSCVVQRRAGQGTRWRRRRMEMYYGLCSPLFFPLIERKEDDEDPARNVFFSSIILE